MVSKTPQDTLTIDPLAMNIVNRVAAGSELSGDLSFEGGLLVQGNLEGHIRVNGRLIIWTGASVRGRIRVTGDLYLFGLLGSASGGAHDTSLECEGMVYVSKTGVSTGTLLAKRLQMYEGAQLRGPFHTLQTNDRLPVLRDVLVQPPAAR